MIRQYPSKVVARKGGLLLAIATALVVAYALAGFLLAPWIAMRELPRLAEEKLQHRARIGALGFNPFTLTLRARDFALQDRGGRPVLGFGEAAVDLEWRSLARRAWVFSEVRLVNPSVQVDISKEGRVNLAALGPQGDAGAAPSARLPRLVIGHLALENGHIGFEDKREGYVNSLERVSLELTSLSTLDAENGPYTLTGQTPGGAALRWNGEFSLAPLAASGTLAVGNAALAELMPYLDDVAAARIVSGRAELELPYRLALAGGKPRLTLNGAKLEVRDLALAADEARPPFLRLGQFALEGVDFDSSTRNASAKALRVVDVVLAAMRDANGELDLARVVKAGGASSDVKPKLKADLKHLAWQASVAAVEIGPVAASYTDATAKTPLALTLRGLNGKVKLAAESDGQGVRVRLDAGEFALAQIDVAGASAQAAASLPQPPQPQQPSLRLADLSIAGARFDSGSNALDIDAVRVATLGANAALEDGRWSLLDLLPVAGAGKPAKPFSVRVKAVELGEGSVSLADRASGVALALERLTAKFAAVSSDGTKPLAFEVSAGVKSGGRIGLRGRMVPAQGSLDARLEASAVALAPLQPLLGRYEGVKLASGDASLSGSLRAGAKAAKLAYAGTASVANVALDDAAGARLLGWKSLATESLRLSLSPDRVEIDELRWTGPAGKLAIATDGTSNLSRAFAKQDAARQDAARKDASPEAGAETAPDPAKDAAQPADETAFMVAVRRVRVEQGALDFSDDSLSPGYVAKIYDLAGTANGLSSDRSTRSQFDFEGRVDEFGFARLSGSINPFAPRERTAFRVQLRNIDLATVSPYSMRFAGYRMASGRMSLDLNYRVRASVIEGDNKITLEKLTLGERVESPDALKLPLELAIALLKDADGTISMQLPVTGNLDDPQFSFAPIIWKAVGNFLGGIIAAPFRALARLFGGGGSGEEAGAIAFEPGSSRLQPPEREKIGRIVEALAKRPELKLIIPGRYDAEADARALKRAELGRGIARRAGFAVAEEESPGPINLEDRPTRAALRTLFAERYSAAELDQLKAEAERRAAGAPALSVADRLRNFAAGEPQVADAREFYATLLRRLRDAQPLAPNALAELAQKRSRAIEGALRAAGADAARIAQTAAQPTADAQAKQVTVQLSLSAR